MRGRLMTGAMLLLLGACSAVPGFEPGPKFLATPALPAGVYPTPAPVYANSPATPTTTAPAPARRSE